MTYQFFLASSSPRRKELIDLLKIPYKICAPDVDETLDIKLGLVDQCLYLAELKAQKVKSDIMQKMQQSGVLILAADTLVGLLGQKLEKPKDSNEAKKMLHFLSAKKHQVVTGMCFIYSQDLIHWEKEKIYAETFVTFHKLSAEMIDFYVDSKDGLDKAGAYGIQGFAQTFVSSLEGTYANVVGLPLDLVVQFLENKISTGKLNWPSLFF